MDQEQLLIVKHRLLERISELAPPDRALVTMRYWERKTYKEIGAALGLPVGTVGSKLARIRSVLHERLEEPQHEARHHITVIRGVSKARRFESRPGQPIFRAKLRPSADREPWHR